MNKSKYHSSYCIEMRWYWWVVIIIVVLLGLSIASGFNFTQVLLSQFLVAAEKH
jgi:hypothetical protein